MSCRMDIVHWALEDSVCYATLATERLGGRSARLPVNMSDIANEDFNRLQNWEEHMSVEAMAFARSLDLTPSYRPSTKSNNAGTYRHDAV